MNMNGTELSWGAVLMRRAVVIRGLWFAVVVGAILIAINHGDAILNGDFTPGRLVRMGLTMLVPYCVSVLSSASAIRRQHSRRVDC